jgi:phosphatidate cytidylyltransferase
MLKQRIVTALILATIVIGGILFAETRWVSLLFTLVLFAAAREFVLLTLKPAAWAAIVAGILFAALYWWSLEFSTAGLVYAQSLAGIALWMLVAIGFRFYRHQENRPLLARVVMLGLGLDLLWICGHGVVYLHQAHGGEVLLYMLTLVWLADIGAYFSGRKFGKRKLAPSISPGKTWEGVYGGVLVNLIWILLVFWLIDGWGIGLLPFVLIGVATVAISVVGDLFESVLKREAGVKDSGQLLPGHGGVLDRIDSVIAATPVFVSGFMIAGSA